MAELDLDNFRTLLLEQQQELLAVQASGEAASQVVELDQTSVGRLSRMDAMQAQAMSIETDQRRKQELLRIKAAIRRLDDGEYGYCENCGNQINPLRLKTRPTVTLCIDCASEMEAG